MRRTAGQTPRRRSCEPPPQPRRQPLRPSADQHSQRLLLLLLLLAPCYMRLRLRLRQLERAQRASGGTSASYQYILE